MRCGVGTAYPHPNQMHYNKIQKGQALQIAGGVAIAGCGGELYRAFLLAPWTDHQKKVWTVVARLLPHAEGPLARRRRLLDASPTRSTSTR